MVRTLLRVIVALIILAALGALALAILSSAKPTWYQPPDPESDAVAEVADSFEYSLGEQTQKVRPKEEPWALRVRDEHVNAWLSNRLRRWLSNQGTAWPEQVGTPQVRVEDGIVKLALPIGPEGQRSVIVASVQPRIAGEQLWMSLERIQVGRIPIPGDPIKTLMSYLQDAAPAGNESIDEVLGLLTGQTPIEPILELPDGRTVELLQVDCRDGYVDLISRTIGPGRRDE